ncbi:hypothetical protein B9G55_17700 [Saccharibacillus sp. O16]|nr:hypothetical protein B9G55_17700 [Saccharibacillus sp. O16]
MTIQYRQFKEDQPMNGKRRMIPLLGAAIMLGSLTPAGGASADFANGSAYANFADHSLGANFASEGTSANSLPDNSYADAIEEGENTLSAKSAQENHASDAAVDASLKTSTSEAVPLVWNSNFENVIISEGDWKADSGGIRGAAAADASPALRSYASPEAEAFVFTADVSPLSDSTSAGLMFGGTSAGGQGYDVWLDRQDGQAKVSVTAPDGSLLTQSERSYPSETGVRHRLEIQKEAGEVRIFVDGYEAPAVELSGIDSAGTAAGVIVRRGEAVFQDAYLTSQHDYYGETYRPAYHYSPPRGSASDPNGMIYYKGEYHLFHQDGGRWAHAVSTDLLHWKSLPIALDWNSQGHIWSGSTIADPDNVSGLFDHSPDGGGLIAYYTSYTPDAPNGNQKIGLAFSSDRGRTWRYPDQRSIVIENPGKQGDDPGAWDFRDPKVVRDDAHNRWVMVVSGGDHIRFFVSTNLLDWTLTDNFGYGSYVRGGVWECPDLFELAVEGTNERRWVLMVSTGANPATQGSDAEYFVGQLTAEGKFVNDNPAGTVLRTDYGKEFYASSSFTDAPNGRRIIMAWMTNWDYPFAFPTSGWKGVLSLPRELSLKQTVSGIRLTQTPISELHSLRHELRRVGEQTMDAQSPNLLAGLAAGAYEIEAELELPQEGAAQNLGFRLREGGSQFTDLRYSSVEGKWTLDRSSSGIVDYSPLLGLRQEAGFRPEDGRIRLRIFVDESSIEAFAADGQLVFSDVIFPGTARREMSFYTEGGQVKIHSLKVYALDSVWKKTNPSELVTDEQAVELGLGSRQTVHVSPRVSSSADASSFTWTSSDSSIVTAAASSDGSAVLKAVGAGQTTVKVKGPNGASCDIAVTVYGGSFRSNLGTLTSTPSSAKWIVTEEGLRGSAQGDSIARSNTQAGDFVYKASVKLDPSGGAASLLLRSDAAGGSGYYLNLDPNMDALRLFYKVGGSFAERQVLARYPTEIQSGRTYQLRVQAEGPRIRAWLDDKLALDVRDGTFVEGYVGLHTFGGRAFFQDVQLSKVKPAKLRSFQLTNESSGRKLITAGQERGASVSLEAANEAGLMWTSIPTGSPDGSVSLRTPEGLTLDLDVGRGALQLYDYLGYDNQRWLLRSGARGTFSILNAANGLALTEKADGSAALQPLKAGDRAQQWKLKR